jgi:hypothetical protein
MSVPPPPHNYILVRLAIAGVAAVGAMFLAGIPRPVDRPRLWGGALILAIAVGLALALPIGGPHIPTLPVYHGRSGYRSLSTTFGIPFGSGSREPVR